MSSISLKNTSGNAITLQSSTSLASDVTLTLPVNDGDASQFLQTDGAGVLSWQTVTTGKILKVEQSSAHATTASSTSTTFSDTGLSASFTPSAAGSSILIIVYQGQGTKTAADTQLEVKLQRGTTDVGNTWHGCNTNNSTADTNNPIFLVLDTPTYTLGNSITYKTQFRNRDGNGTVAVNGGGAYFTFLEVAA